MDERKESKVNMKRVLQAAGVAAAIAAAYAIGAKVSWRRAIDNIRAAWCVDPTLKDHMIAVAKKMDEMKYI